MAAPAIPPTRPGLIGTGLAIGEPRPPTLRGPADRYVITEPPGSRSGQVVPRLPGGRSSPGRRQGRVVGPRPAHVRRGRAPEKADRCRRGAVRRLPRTGGRTSRPHLPRSPELLPPQRPAPHPRIARRRRDRPPAPDGVAAHRPIGAPREHVHRQAVTATAAVPRRRAPHRPDPAVPRRHPAPARCRAGGRQHRSTTNAMVVRRIPDPAERTAVPVLARGSTGLSDGLPGQHTSTASFAA